MSITLTASMRSNLSSLKVIQSQMDKTQERLSTGKKVNSAIDNASSYYQSRSLTNRAADLDSLLDSMGQGVQTIQAANEGIEAITSFVEQMKSVAESAASLDSNAAGYADKVADYAAQFDAIKAQITDIAEDSFYQGVNLLIGNTLKVVFNETRTNDLTVSGKNIVNEMDITAASGDEGWKVGAEKITASIGEITTAIETLRSFATELGNNFTIIETRQNFTEAMVDVLETGADKLVLADMNEESANYLALQTRQQLAINSLALASQSAQSVLSLF
ncbi:MAG: flagellin [Alphaproteobacteria bacterium]|nr:flagellin [Alphaproteobacteria bacterium]